MAMRSLSTATLRAELARRERGASKLAAQRDKLQRQLDGVLGELADLGVDGAPRPGRPPGRRGPGRPKGSKNRKPGRRGPGRPKGSKNKKPGSRKGKAAKNSMTLIQAMAKGVRPGATVSPAQAAVAAERAGYKSTSKNLGVMAGMAIAKAKEFKRVGRGQYLRKGGAAGIPTKVKQGRTPRAPKAAKRGHPKGKRGGRRKAASPKRATKPAAPAEAVAS